MAASLDQALGPLERHFSDLGVILDRLVERRGDDLALDRAPHVGHFLRALTNQTDHQVHVGVVGRDAVGDRLQQEGLAGLGRRHDQTTLPAADRRNQVEQTRRQDIRLRLEVDQFEREDRRQRVEIGPTSGDFGVDPVDRLHTQEAEEFLIVLRRTNLAANTIAGAEAETADLGLRHINVVQARQQTRPSKKAETVLVDLEDAVAKDVAIPLGLRLQQADDQIRLLRPGVSLELEVAGELVQLFRRLGVELTNVEIRATLFARPQWLWLLLYLRLRLPLAPFVAIAVPLRTIATLATAVTVTPTLVTLSGDRLQLLCLSIRTFCSAWAITVVRRRYPDVRGLVEGKGSAID